MSNGNYTCLVCRKKGSVPPKSKMHGDKVSGTCPDCRKGKTAKPFFPESLLVRHPDAKSTVIEWYHPNADHVK